MLNEDETAEMQQRVYAIGTKVLRRFPESICRTTVNSLLDP